MNPGDTYLHHGEVVTVLGPADYEDYERNRPGPKWELIRYPNGHEAWCGNIWLEPIGDQNGS
jgi:hypothetical protein